jgi:hypothetical protein
MGWLKEFITNWKFGNNVRRELGRSRQEWYKDWHDRHKFIRWFKKISPEIRDLINNHLHQIDHEGSKEITQKINTAALHTEMKKMKVEWQ